jgi:hypothetical protein
MHSLSSIITTKSALGEPRIVERARGTAHPVAAMTTRERVARSLLLHPSTAGATRPLTLRQF